MTILPKIKPHSDVVDYFKELQFLINLLKNQNLNV